MKLIVGSRWIQFNYNPWQANKLWYSKLLDGIYISWFRFTLIAKLRNEECQ